MAVALLIPAYRPDARLCEVVSDVLALDRSGLIERVLVVDDGSGADCVPAFDQVGRLRSTSVLTLGTNGGKGAALKAGVRALLNDAASEAGIVTADADGQHAPGDILRVAAALVAQPDHLILGVRRFDGRVPFRNKLGNRLMCRLVRWRTGMSLSDTQTGLRGWPMSRASSLLEITGDRYDWELRALLSAAGSPIVEIPIATIYAGQTSHFRPVRDSIAVCRALRKAPNFRSSST
jgi:glycosyltransferase involved in cell wall biosynthesis